MMDSILDVIFGLLSWVASALPEWSPGHSDAIQGFFNVLSGINNVFPLVELAECTGIVLGFHALLLVWRPLLKFIRVA